MAENQPGRGYWARSGRRRFFQPYPGNAHVRPASMAMAACGAGCKCAARDRPRPGILVAGGNLDAGLKIDRGRAECEAHYRAAVGRIIASMVPP